MNSTVCTQCKQPLFLDSSLVDLAPSAYDLIAGSLPPSPHQVHATDDEAQLPASSSAKMWHNSAQPASNTLSSRAQEKQRVPGIPIPGESFVLLQDSAVHNIPSPPDTSLSSQRRLSFTSRNRNTLNSGDPSKRSSSADLRQPPTPTPAPPSTSPLSHHLESTARLFKLLSSRTDLDQPLCAECTRLLIATFSKQLEETKKERDGYIAFEKEIRKEKERARDAASPDVIERKISRLKDDEKTAVEELKAAESERERLNSEIQALERAERELQEEEAESVCFWYMYVIQHSSGCLDSGGYTTRIYCPLQSRLRNYVR
jgi:beclin